MVMVMTMMIVRLIMMVAMMFKMMPMPLQCIGNGIYDAEDDDKLIILICGCKCKQCLFYNLHDALMMIMLMLLMISLMIILMRLVSMVMPVITEAKPFCSNPHIPIRGEIGPSFLSSA